MSDHLRLHHGTVDVARQLFCKLDGEIKLSPTEVKLLSYLADHAGAVVSKELLLVDVWGYKPGIASRTVVSTVERVRKKIEADPSKPQSLLTDGVGYRLVMAPEEATPDDFVGRAAELTGLSQRLLGQPALLTLTGPGGVGKTRLAQKLVTTVGPRFSSVIAVDMDGVDTHEGFEQRLAAALSVPKDRTRAALQARKPALLWLDDLDALSGKITESVGALSGVSGLTILTTSRAALELPHEEVYALGPMLPADARALLFARAPTRVAPEALAPLCEALDHLPLALILAAPRLALLSPSELLRRMEAETRSLTLLSAPGAGRHASLRRCIEASFSQLEADDVQALAMLAILPGTFPVDAAETLLQGLDGEPLDRVQRLISQALLLVEQGAQTRYRMLSSVRAVARARLADLTGAQQRFFAWANARLADDLPGLERGDRQAIARLLPEIGLLVGARPFAPHPEAMVRYTIHLARAHLRLYLDPRLFTWLDEAVVAAADPTLRAHALRVRADYKLRVGGDAGPDLLASLATHPSPEAQILLGTHLKRRGDLAGAQAAIEAGAVGESRARALIELATIDRAQGRHTEALARLNEALILAHTAQNHRVEMLAAASCGTNERSLGRLVEAEASLRRAIRAAEAAGDLENMAHLHGNLANLCIVTQRHNEAERLLNEARAHYRQSGMRRSEAFILHNQAIVRMARQQLRAALVLAAEAAALFIEVQEPLSAAATTALMGRLLHATGEPAEAEARYRDVLVLLHGRAPDLNGQTRAFLALACADQGRTAEAHQEAAAAEEAVRAAARGPALVRFVRDGLDAFEQGDRARVEQLRERLGSTALDGEVLW